MSDQNTDSFLQANSLDKPSGDGEISTVKSLRELIDIVSGKSAAFELPAEDAGLADNLQFPFFGLVGQPEMKLALVLALINPAIGGVLLIGPRGTGKTTAARSLVDLLPDVRRSVCYYGCLPEDIETGGIDAVCPDCARKYGEGDPLARTEKAVMVELPLNARLEDVVGGLDERAALHQRVRLKRGILAQADQNLLYVDEVNLLSDEIIDAILDSASQGKYSVRRGSVSATFRSRFVLIGTMNPEEGSLRPQIMDRFGLRVLVRGLENREERLLAYRRVNKYRNNPNRIVNDFKDQTFLANQEIQYARNHLSEVILPDDVAFTGIELVNKLGIDSLRAEITLFETARAYSLADGRSRVEINDLRAIAPMVLRLRRSEFMVKYISDRNNEDEKMLKTIDQVLGGENKVSKESE